MKQIVRRLKALGDITRLKILKLLQCGTACVCEITAVLGLAQPTISRHLRVLEDAGFVYSTRRGLRVDYSLSGDEASPEVRQMLDMVSAWLEDDPEIKALRERLQHISRLNCEVKGNVTDLIKKPLLPEDGLA